MGNDKRVALADGKWTKGTIAYEIAKRLIARDRVYEDDLVKEVLKLQPGHPEYEHGLKIIRRNVEKLRAGDKDDPDVILAYAGWDVVEQNTIDPLTGRKAKIKRKFYFNGKTYDDLKQKLEQLLAAGFGMIRRHDRNMDILRMVWPERLLKIVEAMKEFEEQRERLAPIISQDVEQRKEEIIVAMGGLPTSGQLPTDPNNATRCICTICQRSIPKHEEVRHMMRHRKEGAADQAEMEKESAKEELDKAEDHFIGSFADLVEKEKEAAKVA